MNDALTASRVVRDEGRRFPFPGYPRGWFAVALSSDLEEGPPRILRYFGRDLIAYRGESGRAYVTDAYCPHLGAHLGHGGTVHGESIRCPFHGWRFGGDGRCEEVPYSDRIPPKARLDAFPVREQDGVVHVFYDPDGGEPWELPAFETQGWTPGKPVVWRGLATHPQEVFENTVDLAHLGPVHGGRSPRLLGEPKRDGERFVVDIEFQAPGDVVDMPDQLNDVHLCVTMRGLGWSFVETHVRNVGVRARQRIYATPIDEGHLDLRGIISVRETDDEAFTEELAELFHHAFEVDFAKDFPIWENKRYLERPGLAKGDGPIGLYRKWCSQFYVEEEAKLTRRAEAPSGQLVDAGRLVRGLKERVATRTHQVAGLLSVARGWVTRDTPAQEEVAAAPASSPVAAPIPAAAPKPAPVTQPVASAEEYFESLPKRFVPSAAKGVDKVFQWELLGEDGDTFHAHVHDGRVDVVRGPHRSPSVTLVMPAADYVQVINGEMDGTWAFTSGRGKVKGSLTAAMKMRTLFPL